MLDGPRDEATVRLARRRFARRQWARRWLAWRRVLSVLVVLALVCGAAWLVLASSVLAVHTVQVVGNQSLDPRAVRRAAQVPIGDPLARVDLEAIAARVEQLPEVDRVDVTRAWPDSVRVRVDERVPVAVVRQNGKLRGLDAEGVVFRTFLSAPERLPVIHVGTRTGADALAEGAAVVGALPESVAARVDFVTVESIDRISLRLHDGRTVVWGSADDSGAKARVLDVLLESVPEASTYDVSVPGQPTTR
ncbi:MAG TPA: FtsQ-type POTRA domain-containing protein [Nocardioidaceae bacterium]|nr:FtsQ-type POTRA domain-containing protein [Nocardioidaceae bacterium]